MLTFILCCWTSEVHTSFSSSSELIKFIELVNDDPDAAVAASKRRPQKVDLKKKVGKLLSSGLGGKKRRYHLHTGARINFST